MSGGHSSLCLQFCGGLQIFLFISTCLRKAMAYSAEYHPQRNSWLGKFTGIDCRQQLAKGTNTMSLAKPISGQLKKSAY